MQDEKLQDNIQQPVHKLIEWNQLKMVRCLVLVPATEGLSTHVALLLMPWLSDPE